MKKFLLIIIGSLLIITNSNAESFTEALSKAFKNNSELNAERENIIISEQELKISQGAKKTQINLQINQVEMQLLMM